MDYPEILSPGQKIRKIRRELCLKQHEITGEEITRNLISIVENDKASLTPSVAEVIATNINNICKEKNIDFQVSSSYLLESVKTQAERVADCLIELLDEKSKNIEEELSKDFLDIENFLASYDVEDKRTVIYEKIGDILRLQKDYYKSYTYFIKALESSTQLFNDNRISKLLLKINYCCLRTKRYAEALDFVKLAFTYSDCIPKELQYDLLFNNVLVYKNIGQYDKALNQLKYIENNLDELAARDTFDILTLKSNCLTSLKLNKEALVIQKNLLNLIETRDTVKQMVVISNMLENYRTLGDLESFSYYLDKFIVLANSSVTINYEEHYGSTLYKSLGSNCSFINDYTSAEKYYNLSATMAKVNKQHDVLIGSLEGLFDIYHLNNSIKEVKNIENELLNLINLDVSYKSNTLLFKIISFYNDKDYKEALKNLLDAILKL